MTEKFLICIDLDGTLLRDDKTISEETKKYLRFLETQGHYVCLTSGRPTYNVKKYYDEIGLKSSPIISFNGHLAKNLEKNIEYLSHYFSKSPYEQVHLLLYISHHPVSHNLSHSWQQHILTL